MNKLAYLVISVALFGGFLIQQAQVLPKASKYAADIVFVAVLIPVLGRMAYQKSIALHPKYFILFLVLVAHVLAGILANHMQPGTVVAGGRQYFKFVSIFLIPTVYAFTDQEIQGQLKFLLVVALAQLPIASFQMFVLGEVGDGVTGTLAVSSILSMYLVGSVCILMAMYLKRLVSLRTLLLLTPCLLFPATLNETKGSMVLLPLGLLGVVLFSQEVRRNKGQLAGVLAAGVMAFAGLVVMYDYMYASSAEGGKGSIYRSSGIVEFFLSPDQGFGEYLYRDVENELDERSMLDTEHGVVGEKLIMNEEGNYYGLRRLDTVTLPFTVLSDTPMKLMLGLGIGNTSQFAGKILSGKYGYLEDVALAKWTLLGQLVWDIGVVGLVICIVMMIVVIGDSVRLSKEEGVIGAIGLGWVGVMLMFIASLPYKNLLLLNSTGFLMAYFSGYVAASRMRIDRKRAGVQVDRMVSD